MKSILWRELRVNFRSLLIWTVILAALAFFTMSVFESIELGEGQYDDFINILPEAMQKAFGFDRLSFTEPLGYYSADVYFLVVLFGGIYAAILGSGIMAKEEEEKTIELLLARPVSRVRILAGKFLAVLLNLLFLNVCTGLVVLAAFKTFVSIPYSQPVLLMLLAAPFLAHLTFGCFGFLTSSLFFRRRQAMSASIGMVLAFYFLDVLAGLSEKMELLGRLTPFRYISAPDIVMNEQIGCSNILILLGAGAAAMVLSHLLFCRRDILI